MPANTCREFGRVSISRGVARHLPPCGRKLTRDAVKYQVVVMLLITCAVALSSFLFLRLAVRRYLTPAHQLRRQLIL